MSRILLISDLHGNAEALKAVLEKVEYDSVLCMGDLVDYGPDPAECVEWIRGNNVPTVRGNHDNAVATHVDCGCGYKYKHLSEASRQYTWSSIGDRDMTFLKKLPMTIEITVDGMRLMLAHGSPDSFFDYIFPDTPQDQLESMTKNLDCEWLIVGHTHKPAILHTSRTTILNPGSVGQPRDGDPRASCMILDTLTKSASIIRVTYDIDATCKKIESRVPLANELIAILKRGF